MQASSECIQSVLYHHVVARQLGQCEHPEKLLFGDVAVDPDAILVRDSKAPNVVGATKADAVLAGWWSQDTRTWWGLVSPTTALWLVVYPLILLSTLGDGLPCGACLVRYLC